MAMPNEHVEDSLRTALCKLVYPEVEGILIHLDEAREAQQRAEVTTKSVNVEFLNQLLQLGIPDTANLEPLLKQFHRDQKKKGKNDG